MTLESKNLSKEFLYKKKKLFAVQDVSLNIEKGTTVGLVGESGCGKSTLGLMLAKLLAPTNGSVFFQGQNLEDLSREELKKFRKKVQIVFQDPYSSLNPRMTIRKILREPFEIHKEPSSDGKIGELLSQVGLPMSYSDYYPHQLSGGQRQRVGIARALALSPECIICDEPLSALDISIQSQIVHLLQRLQKEFQLGYLFISHNLEVVRRLTQKLNVMYLGKIVEEGPTEKIYTNPLHPYTEALISAASFTIGKRPKIVLKGEIPTPFQIQRGCVFASRCPKASAICHSASPEKKEIHPGHYVTCHLY